MTAANWRDQLKVHAACESFREMTLEELADLADDIAKYEDLIHPIVLWRSAEDKPYELIDGRSRLDAMATLPDGEKRIRKALDRPIRKAAPACDPWKYVESVNDRRRHLMPEDRRERRERIARELKRDPHQSDRTIAKATGASPSTVGTERKEQEQIGTVSRLDTRIGKDGVAQPASKPPVHRQPPAYVVANTVPRPAPVLSRRGCGSRAAWWWRSGSTLPNLPHLAVVAVRRDRTPRLPN
jgi:DNA-binding Lrp family transcriptional regulator